MDITTNWADNSRNKVSTTFKNARSGFGDFVDKTYNNVKTANVITSPTYTYFSDNKATARNADYSKSKDTYKTSDAVYRPSTSKTSTSKAYQQNRDKSNTVENIQKSLNTLGYKYGNEGELEIDGYFGPKTQSNWNKFLVDRGSKNYLSNITSPLPKVPKSWVGDYGWEHSDEYDFQVPKPSQIGPSTGDEYIFYGDPITEFKRNVLGLDDEDLNNKSNYNLNELILDAIGSSSSFGDFLKNADLYAKSKLFGNEELLDAAKVAGKNLSKLGKLVDYGEFGLNIAQGDIDEAAINLAGIAGGTAGGLLGGAIGVPFGGIPGIATGAFGTLAGSELMKNIVKDILDKS